MGEDMRQLSADGSAALHKPGILSGQRGQSLRCLTRSRGGLLEEAPTSLPSHLGPFHDLRIVVCCTMGLDVPALGEQRFFAGPPAMRDRLAMVGRQARLRPYRFARCGAAWGVIREGRGAIAAAVLDVLEQWLGVLPRRRRRFRGHEDAVRLILNDHPTVLRAPRGVAVQVTLRGWGERKPWLQPLRGGGSRRAKGIKPALERRLGKRHHEQHGEEERNVPAADPPHHRTVAGQPADPRAHRLGG
jgi:hypothetical protein